jgi:hypothetical protein
VVADQAGNSDIATVTVNINSQQSYSQLVDWEMSRALQANPNNIPLAIELARAYVLNDVRDQDSTNTAGRDAEYYLIGLYAGYTHDPYTTALVFGAPVYNIYKSIANLLNAQTLIQADPGKLNSPPGGTSAAYQGLLDGFNLNRSNPGGATNTPVQVYQLLNQDPPNDSATVPALYSFYPGQETTVNVFYSNNVPVDNVGRVIIDENTPALTVGDGNNFIYGGPTSTDITAGNGNNVIITTAANAVLRAGNGNNVLIADGKNDTVYGGSGNDVLMGDGGNDTLIGGQGGVTTAAFMGPQSEYSITIQGGQATVIDNRPAGSGADTLEDVQFLQFADLTVPLDQDSGEQALLNLTVNVTAINATTAATVPFTIAGLDAEDKGTVTFTDANGKTVQVNVNAGQTSYTADLTSLADGTITSSLAVNPDAAGNTFKPVSGTTGTSGTTLTLTQLDHWTNTSGGNWTTASSWSTWNGTHAVPTATIDADFDASGTYAVNITTADTAYAVLLNDSGATISDNSGGSLTLTGAGGAQSPNGVLSINQGKFVLAGGSLRAGSISIGAGGTFLVTQGQYAGQNSIPAVGDNGSFTLANNASANITGGVSGAGSFTVGGNASLTVSGADTVTGSFTIGNNSILEFVAPETAKIIFAGSNSLLKFDAVSPTGQISGLNANDKIDLAGLRWVQGSMTARFSGNTSGGILTVSDGAQSVAINLAGNYLQSSWNLSADKTGGTFVVDPPAVASHTAPGDIASNGTVISGELLELKPGEVENVQFAADTGTLKLGDAQHFAGLISGFSGQDVLDLADIAFSPNMSLGYAANTNNSGGNLTVNDGTHVASLALLGNYMASSFVASSDGHGGTFIEPSQIASSQQFVLTHPHA